MNTINLLKQQINYEKDKVSLRLGSKRFSINAYNHIPNLIHL